MRPADRATNVTVVRHGPFYRDPRVVKQCLALCDSGFDVTVLCRGSSTPWVSRDNLRVVEVKGQVAENPLRLALQSLGFLFRVAASVLRGRSPDVVVVHSIPSWLVFGAVAVRLRNRRARILLDHHEPEAEMLGEAGLPSPAVRVYRWIERAALRVCDGVVDVSPEMAERSRALGARAQVVVDNAPMIFDDGPPVEKTWDLAVFGSLIPRYDLPAMERALALVDEPVDVVQIGHGAAAVARNDSGGRLQSFPYSPPPDLQAHLRASRFGFVGLAPSDFTDFVSPNRLWELVSLEVPAIVAETELTRRLMAEQAIYYTGGDAESLRDAIRRALALDADEAAAMAAAARSRLRDRLWDRQSVRFVEFCRREVGERPASNASRSA
jgi:glycosyltransferase involved in cell wall biosynthesis